MSNFKNLSDTEYRIALKDFPTHLLLEELERRANRLDKKRDLVDNEISTIKTNSSLMRLQAWASK